MLVGTTKNEKRRKQTNKHTCGPRDVDVSWAFCHPLSSRHLPVLPSSPCHLPVIPASVVSPPVAPTARCHHCCCCSVIVPLSSSLLSSFHPQSTPRAVACEAGRGWCCSFVIVVPCSALLFSLFSSSSTRDPPCDQGLTAVWWVLSRLHHPVLFVIVVSSPS